MSEYFCCLYVQLYVYLPVCLSVHLLEGGIEFSNWRALELLETVL